MSFLNELPKPIFALAPMDNVTDTVFRQIVADCAPPDLYFTEFVNVDGLHSPGRPKLIKKLQFTPKEKPIFAQLWGLKPENFYKTVKEIIDGTLVAEINNSRQSSSSKVQGHSTLREEPSGPSTVSSGRTGSDSKRSQERRVSRTKVTVSELRAQLPIRQAQGTLSGNRRVTPQFAESSSGVSGSARRQAAAAGLSGGFAGVDLNMGCPVKTVIKNGACAALINNRELAGEIIDATREGANSTSSGQAGSSFPVSVKTRVGFSTTDMSWLEFLLSKKLDLLSIHGRTAKQLSNVPADWDLIGQVRERRDSLCPTTLVVGNGDVMTRQQGIRLAEKYKLDGIMIGRGIFHDPFVFAPPVGGQASPWEDYAKKQKIELFRRHIELFMKTWIHGEYKFEVLKKFAKIYINGFDGASDLRAKLMLANSADKLLVTLEKE